MARNKNSANPRSSRPCWSRWIYFTVGLAAIWGGRVVSNDLLMLAGCVILVWSFFLLIKSDRKACSGCRQGKWAEDIEDKVEIDEVPDPRPVPACERVQGGGVKERDALVEQMLCQSRYALLLRPQIASELEREQFARVVHAFDEGMALVPDGEVVLNLCTERSCDISTSEYEPADLPSRTVRVQRFFLDRYPVTNHQYYEFVAAGGYEQVSLWEESVLPAMLDFVDSTGHAGPRFWKEGCYLKGQENRPVVGVSWYEALAYAGWVGKRLPTEAEWVKAGSWPVAISNNSHFQRRYPWGEMIDRKRANLWGSGPGKIVDVDKFEEGVSVGGVYQLIGNVWEWTVDDFHPEYVLPKNATMEVSLKNIHGGAFDTYFDNQATCQFQSGENALARRHNIGFRLAISVCDLALAKTTKNAPEAQNACPQRSTDNLKSEGDNNIAQADDAAEKVGTEEVSV